MAFSPRGRQLSIPKGEEPGFSQLPYSREVSERRAASWPRAMSTVPKKEGSRPPSWAPSPGSCPPLAYQALTPDRCVSIYAAETAGFKIARVPDSVCAPQGRSAEPDNLLAGARKEQEVTTTHSPVSGPAGARPSLPNPSHSIRKVCAPSRW